MATTNAFGSKGRVGTGALLLTLLAGSSGAQVTSQVSVDENGSQQNKDAFDPAISLDGRYVGFFCYDDLLNAGEDSAIFRSDVYLRDRVTGALERISVSSSGAPGNDDSFTPAFSSDVRYVAFSSIATNLVPGDTNGPDWEGMDAFVRDRLTGTTERVSVDSSGAEGNDRSYAGAISADGRYVAFGGGATNLVAGDTNGFDDIFVRDRQLGLTERVSIRTNGAQGNGDSWSPQISADGRFVVFYGSATDLVAQDTNGAEDVFLRDRQLGTTVRVSVTFFGGQGGLASCAPSISADGRYVAFESLASLVIGDMNGVSDIYVRDLLVPFTYCVSLRSGGTLAEADGGSFDPRITPDGRYVAFQSDATNLVPGDTNGTRDIFLRDRETDRTVRVSVDSNGAQGHADSGIDGPAISADGRYVAFDSKAILVEQDTNSGSDIYVRDRDYSPLESLCDPGVDGVMACPCSNPPSGAGRGCDNSSGTGGANLSAAGIAYLSQDTLVFTTSGETPTATSIVLQGNALVSSGVVYGQGIRCAGGTIKRLYTKTASGGSITAPDFGAGDPTVSARSAAIGHAIQPGQSRWYLVYYRDPIVLGGCPPTSTFNATQTGEAVWLP